MQSEICVVELMCIEMAGRLLLISVICSCQLAHEKDPMITRTFSVVLSDIYNPLLPFFKLIIFPPSQALPAEVPSHFPIILSQSPHPPHVSLLLAHCTLPNALLPPSPRFSLSVQSPSADLYRSQQNTKHTKCHAATLDAKPRLIRASTAHPRPPSCR